MRAVVPIYNESFCQGLIGRSLQPQCKICNYYHFPNRSCPNNKIEKLWGSKWRVEKGFKKESYLYNLSKAKPYIQKSRTIVLVESPGNVWRCWENGIYNAVAIFGTTLTANQRLLLEKLLIKYVILCLDNDSAGIEGGQKIEHQLDRTYLVETPKLNYGKYNDFGDMTNTYFLENVCPVLQKIG